MKTRAKAHLTLITLLILAASAFPIGAADPDVYMNTAAPAGTTCPGGPADQARHAASSADADVYLRGDPSTGGSPVADSDFVKMVEVLADVLASLLH